MSTVNLDQLMEEGESPPSCHTHPPQAPCGERIGTRGWASAWQEAGSLGAQWVGMLSPPT